MPSKKAHVRSSRKPRKREKPGGRVRDPIPVAPVRELVILAMEERGMTLSDIASLAGYEVRRDGRRKPETTWLQRRLGLKPEAVCYRKGEAYRAQPHEFINREIAAKIVKAAGWDPVDVRDPVTGESIL